MMMVYYYGEISESKKKNWEQQSGTDPYDLFEWKKKIDSDINTIFRLTPLFLHDEIQVDWGSAAYWGNKEDFIRFFDAIGVPEEANQLEDDKTYAFVYIELY